jgi:hypothetical protein
VRSSFPPLLRKTDLKQIKMKVVKTESDAGRVSSVLIKVDDNLQVWFDIWDKSEMPSSMFDEKELTGDWNKYIFDLKNSEDLKTKEFQMNSENYEECLDLAIDEYEKFEEFTPHGGYTVSNTGGYLIELSECGDSARVKDDYGSDNPQISDWLEIEYVEDEDTGELEPVIDPNGYNIPLNLVMRLD